MRKNYFKRTMPRDELELNNCYSIFYLYPKGTKRVDYDKIVLTIQENATENKYYEELYYFYTHRGESLNVIGMELWQKLETNDVMICSRRILGGHLILGHNFTIHLYSKLGVESC